MGELYDPAQQGLGGFGPVANLAALLALTAQPRQKARILSGCYSPEAFIAIDQASRAGQETWLASPALSAQASLSVLAENSLIGEDSLYLSSGAKPAPAAFLSIQAADLVKILIAIGLLAACILKVMGEI